MPARLRLYDLRYSRLPGLLGITPDNTPELARYANAAELRLLYAKEAGEEGWYGTYGEVAFQVSRTQPFVTLDRHVARLEAANICDWVRPINNQFMEYLRFGNGRMPKTCFQCDNWFLPEGYTRNDAITFRDLSTGPQIIRITSSSPQDADGETKIFLQGLDQNNKAIYSIFECNLVKGIFVKFENPFADSPIRMNRIDGIQKESTFGTVTISQVDPTTGNEIELLTMEPDELVAGYRRYYFHNLPCWCCPPPSTAGGCPPGSPQPITVKAIAKLEHVDATVDTDYFLIHNKEALIEECQSVRYSEMDTPPAKQMAAERHLQAVRLLNGELNHYLGKESPAMQFRPFGSARLARQKIGTLV